MTDQHIYTSRIDAGGGPDPVADQSCVPWWSYTKTVLATAALQLVAQGECKLDDHIDDRHYTLRQLLQHRAGVPNYGELHSYHDAVRARDTPWTAEELFDRVDVSNLDFEPGHGWSYSNVGYLLVRRFIERTVGRDIGEALRILLFDDLGLKSVRLAASPQHLDDIEWGNAAKYDPGWVYHGLLIGTPGDAARFLDRLIAGAVLPHELVIEMTAPHPISDRPMPSRPWQTAGYGLGLMIGKMEGLGLSVGHSGCGPTSVCAVYHFRDLPVPCTGATFAQGSDEGKAEFEAARLARFA